MDNIYLKEHTVSVQLQPNVKISDVLNEFEETHGVDCISAVVPKGVPGSYEITFVKKELAENYSISLSFQGKDYNSRIVGDRTRVVSILYLPVYVSDEDIVKRLKEVGVTPISDVQRHFI